jgi:hypothetical protein
MAMIVQPEVSLVRVEHQNKSNILSEAEDENVDLIEHSKSNNFTDVNVKINDEFEGANDNSSSTQDSAFGDTILSFIRKIT